MEPVILRQLKYKVEDAQIKLVLPINGRIQIVGHPEGRQGTTLLEVKTMAAYSWKMAKKEGVMAYYPQYAMQNACYFAGFGGLVDRSEFILFNKNTSKVKKQKYGYKDLRPFIRQVVQVAKIVEAFVSAGCMCSKPLDLKKWQCLEKYCQFWLCEHNTGHKKYLERR